MTKKKTPAVSAPTEKSAASSTSAVDTRPEFMPSQPDVEETPFEALASICSVLVVGRTLSGSHGQMRRFAVNILGAIGGQKRVQGVNLGSSNAKRDIPLYADLYLQHRMNLDDLVSRTISLREVNDGYESLKSGSLNRVVVTSF